MGRPLGKGPSFGQLYYVHRTHGSPKKVVRKEDGHIAVLVSHGLGGGWYSEYLIEALLFDPTIVKAVLAGTPFKEVRDYLEDTYGEEVFCAAIGYEGLRVHFIEPGTKFRIKQYDGAETLVELSKDDIITA